MSLKQLETFDSGSNYNFEDKMIGPQAPRSAFDLSHLYTTTIPNAGMVFPLGKPIPTVPGDDFDISVDFLLRCMPQVVPLYSRQRVYIYAFWSRYADLWCDWDVFARKGYTGNVIKSVPKLKGHLSGVSSSGIHPVTPDSLGNYLGLPIGMTLDVGGSGTHNHYTAADHCNLLYPMQYLRIWRDYFINRNYYVDDRVILPDDDSRFRLGSDGNLLSAKDEGIDFQFDLLNWTGYTPGTTDTSATFGGFYHEWPKDRFTSALPWPQRGDTPVLPLDVNFDSLSGVLNLPASTTSDYGNNGMNVYASYIAGNVGSRDAYNGYVYASYYGLGSDGVISNGARDLLTGVYTSGRVNPVPDTSNLRNLLYVSGSAPFSATDISVTSSSSLGITLNQLRELSIAQTELEKMARTDGSYAEFGLTFFGEKSKAARDYRPVYIGGTYKNIVFSEVLQTSGSSVGTTDPSSQSPLGAYAGHGIAGQQQGQIGHLHCDDYGSIMFLCCIMPDVYYSQGLDKDWTFSLQSEIFLPERAKLGMIPVLQHELEVTRYVPATSEFYNLSESEATDLFAYQNPYDEMRYIPNQISGKIADPRQKSFYPYTQSRLFGSSLVTWSREFATADDVRKDYLFAPTEDAYSAQFSFNIRAVRPLPYKPVPASIIN